MFFMKPFYIAVLENTRLHYITLNRHGRSGIRVGYFGFGFFGFRNLKPIRVI